MKQYSNPPKLADRFLRWFCSEDLLEEIQGDLHETFFHRRQHMNPLKAKFLYYRDVLQFFKPYSFEKYSRTKQFLPMFKNYLTIASRNILRKSWFTAVNLTGLSLGLLAVLLIGLYLRYEGSHDSSFPQYDQVHRLVNVYRDQVYTCMKFPGYYQSNPSQQLVLLDYLRSQEEVVEAAHFVTSNSAIAGPDRYFVEVQGKKLVQEDVLITNSGASFYSLFPQKFLLGDPQSAFSNWDKAILTETTAEKYFGEQWQTKDVLQETLKIRDSVYVIAGVVENFPNNTHFHTELMLIQQQIPSWAAYTYVKLKPGYEIEPTLARLNQEVDRVYPGYTEDVLSKEIRSVALQDIHFTDGMLYELKPVANRTYLQIFALIGGIILLIVCVNYTNLSVAMYASRQRELGIRKVLGARSSDILFQVLVEAILLTLICLPISLLGVYLILPFFNSLMGVQIDWGESLNGLVLLVFLGLVLVAGLVSALYPAVVYSRKSLLGLFEGKLSTKRGYYRTLTLRNALLAFQFILLIGLLCITGYIYQQMHYLKTYDLGFDSEGVLSFGIASSDQFSPLKAELLQLPEVQEVGSGGLPGNQMYNQLTFKLDETEPVFADGTHIYLDYGSIKALNIDCKACEGLEAGKDRVFVINQTAAERLANVAGIAVGELIGKTLISEPEWENEEFGYGIPHTIEGIIPDYHYFNLKETVNPFLMEVVREAEWNYEVLVKASTKDWFATLSKIRDAYYNLESDLPFQFEFLDQRIKDLYEQERRAGILLASLTGLTVLLAFMGLIGLVAFATVSRQKEIGIRKVLGASVRQILVGINKEFALLVGLSTLMAIPIALVMTRFWLENFAYRIDPNPFWGLLAGGLCFSLVVVVVSLTSFQKARLNPIESLKQET
ncbi:MAG: FtsX-like permease family protein [Bacteroidota bacterium]